MKYNKILKSLTYGLIVTMGVGTMASCTDGFEEANRQGNRASADELGRDNYSTGSFFIQMQNNAFPEQENAYQMNEDLIGNYLGRYMTYANNGFSDKNFARFNAPNGWVRYPFRDALPKVTSAFKDIERLTNKSGVTYAQALILKAQALLRLTDMYGPLPIGEESNVNAYSTQEKVYKTLIANLNTATDIIQPIIIASADAKANEEYDKVYSGKLSNWFKLANSLKLRMAIRMRFADPLYAKQVGEAAVQAGVITQNSENCAITYVPNGQYKTSIEWGDSRACADIESYMTGYSDPRISKYFKDTETKGSRSVIGCLAGAAVGNKTIAGKIYSAANVEQSTRGVWLTASEVTFCRAEGALAGWSNMGGTVKSLYEQAITLSFEQWGAANVSAYLADNTSVQANYEDAANGFGSNQTAVSNITIAWDDSATDEVKLERLITQKWIALFPDGQEGWNEIRRTGYPKVFPVAQSTSGYTIKVPNRIPFDSDELINNRASYEEAVQMLGGADNYATKMWWQKK